MARLEPPPPPPASINGPPPERRRGEARLVEYEQFIDDQIGRTRRTVKLVDVASSLLVLATGLLAFFLVVALAEHWLVRGGLSTTLRAMLFVVLGAGAVYYLWREVWPLVRGRINPVYAAQTIERSNPSLKNSLLNLLLFRERRKEMSAPIYQALEQQAAQGLSRVPIETAVDRSRLIRIGYVFLAVVVLMAAYKVLSPKDPFVTARRVLWPWAEVAAPSRVTIDNIQPGEATVTRGEVVEVSAEVRGIAEDERVELRYSTADGQAVDMSVPMQASESGLRFSGSLPAPSLSTFGVQQDLRYRIEAGDARSREFPLTVVAAPTITVVRIDYDYPDYTGYVDGSMEGTGNIRAIEGTRVTIHAQANTDIEQAEVDFEADGRRDLEMQFEDQLARARFTLGLRPDRHTPEHTAYVLRLTNREGRRNRDPVLHKIDVVPDYAPEIELVAPQEEIRNVQLNETVSIEVEARDPDFALAEVRLRGEVAGQQVLNELLLDEEHEGKFAGRYRLTPARQGLRVGDVLQYWATARDNRTPEANFGKTNRQRLRIVSPDPQQGDPQDQLAERQPGEDDRQPAGDAEQNDAGDQQQQPGQQPDQQPGQADQQTEAGEQADDQQQPGEQAEEQQGEGQPSEGQQPGQGLAGESQPGEQDASDAEQQGQSGGQAGGEPADQQPTAGQGDPSDGETGEDGQPAASQPISPEGDNDGEAFERIVEHLEKQREQQRGEQQQQDQKQNGQPRTGDETRQPSPGDRGDEQQPDASQTEDGPSEKSDKQDGGSEKDSEPRATDGEPGAERPGQDEGPGAETRPDDPGAPSSQPSGERQDDSASPGDQQTTTKGPSGAGDQPGDEQGATEREPDRQPGEKREQDPSGPQQPGDPEPPGTGMQKSDSPGEQGSDRTAGGEEAGEEKSERDGTGSSGQNQSADEGAGESSEQGAGDDSRSGGSDRPADEPTGQPGSETPGQGSQERPGQGDQPGGKPGDQTQPDSSGQSEQSGDAGTDGERQQPSDAGEPGDDRAQGPQDGRTEETEEQRGSDSPAQPGDDPSQPFDGQPGAATPGTGTATGGGGEAGSTAAPSGPAAESEPGGDDPNLDYARRQTELVLDKLSDMLRRREVDQELLDRLGWTEDDLRRFVDRWQERHQAAEAAPDESAERELDDALRSLGLRPPAVRRQAERRQDNLRDLEQARRVPVPLEFQERLRKYNQGISQGRSE